MDSSTALVTLSVISSLCLVAVTVLTVLDRRKSEATQAELTERFLTEISETRQQQQQSLDEVFTGLLTTTPGEYAQIRAAKIQEAAQRAHLASVEYAETQKAQSEEDRERERLDQVAIRQQFEQEQEELDAVVSSVYGGAA
jgi:multidrug efflux pump subunit AcrA (membrane-fusion protein)